MTAYATTLFANPNFLRGVARVLDIGGTLNVCNDSQSTEDADRKAISSDWNAIGFYLSEALGGYEDVEEVK